LLSEAERGAFSRLSVFRGGFQRSAAEKVAGVNLRMLSDLVDKSLLKRSEDARYQVHELLRQYAHEKLKGDSQELEKSKEQHSKYYVDFLKERSSAVMGENLVEIREEIRGEMENVRSAVKWAIKVWDKDRAREVLTAYYDFLLVHGWHEARDTFIYLADFIKTERADPEYPDPMKDPIYLLAKVSESRLHVSLGALYDAEKIVTETLPAIREYGISLELGSVLFSQASVLSLKGQYEEAFPVFDEALTVGRDINEDILVAIALLYSGWNFFAMGDYDRAQVDFDESYRILDDQGNQWGKAFALSKLGLVSDGMKDFERSIQQHTEAKEILTAYGDKSGIAYTTSRLSMGAFGLGNYEQAREFGLEGFERFHEIGHRWGMTASLCRLGFAELKLGEVDEAHANFYEGLARALEIEYIPLALYAISGVASVLVEKGDQTRAVELFEFFHNHPSTHPLWKEFAEPWSSAAAAALSSDELEQAKARGMGFEFEALVEELLREGKGSTKE
jgi:tetratricopeptide (TPR) repeat protein